MKKYKYPKTPHIPQSHSKEADDTHLNRVDHLYAIPRVVVTEKMDGENTTMYRNYIHARSVDSKHHPSRDWVKAFHAMINWMIPEDLRLIGENLYAKHSIFYEDLASYFYLFSVSRQDSFLAWDVVEEWSRRIKAPTPRVLFDGTLTPEVIDSLIKNIDTEKQEGFVIRNYYGFKKADFAMNVAKYVRPKHVNTSDHWMHEQITKNHLQVST